MNTKEPEQRLQRIRDYITAKNPDLLNRVRDVIIVRRNDQFTEAGSIAASILGIIEDEIEFLATTQLGTKSGGPLKC